MVTIKDLKFTEFIAEVEIQNKIKELAGRINADYKDKTPVFLPVLNGAFMFSADLIKELTIPCTVSFVKVASYSGMQSSGQLKTLIGLEQSLFNQHIILVEDIVDTGLTLQIIVEELKALGTKSVEVVSLLRKKAARDKGVEPKYIGFDIGGEFVLGYGLDYDGFGRHYRDIYKEFPG